MAVYNGPPRGGSRGGRDQFNWDAVKGDKDREYYLGHSVKALTGRWQKGKDVYWYTREKESEQSAAAVSDELQAVKDREAQLMAEALGMKVPASKATGPRLEKHEMDKLLERNNSTDADAMAVKGLGFAPRVMGGLPAAHERLPADGLPSMAGGSSQLPGPPPDAPQESSKKRLRADTDSPVLGSRHISEKSKKSKKDKREKKEKKHKHEKKHSKEKKRRRRSPSR